MWAKSTQRQIAQGMSLMVCVISNIKAFLLSKNALIAHDIAMFGSCSSSQHAPWDMHDFPSTLHGKSSWEYKENCSDRLSSFTWLHDVTLPIESAPASPSTKPKEIMKYPDGCESMTPPAQKQYSFGHVASPCCSSSSSTTHTFPAERCNEEPPLWHRLDVSNHLRHLLDCCYFQKGIDDTFYIDEPSLRMLDTQVRTRCHCFDVLITI